MGKFKVIRAQEEYQRAGAYSVRIQGMNREHHISLREEFDEHDGAECKYIVLLDDEYPVATCRFYPLSESRVLVGRVLFCPNTEVKSSEERLFARPKSGYRSSVIQRS